MVTTNVSYGITVDCLPTKNMPATKGVSKPPVKGDKLEKKKAKRNSSLMKDKDDETGDGGGSDICVDCGKGVSEEQQGLLCDCCEYWHHSTCEKVSDEIYNFLHKHNNEQSILWYCRKCLKISKKMSTVLINVLEQHQSLENQVNELSNKMQQRFEEMTKVLTSSLEKQCQPSSSVSLDNPKRVEEKVDKLREDMEKHRKAENHTVLDGIGDAVKLRLEEDRQEVEEINK